jgi:hypothetical protein
LSFFAYDHYSPNSAKPTLGVWGLAPKKLIGLMLLPMDIKKKGSIRFLILEVVVVFNAFVVMILVVMLFLGWRLSKQGYGCW